MLLTNHQNFFFIRILSLQSISIAYFLAKLIEKFLDFLKMTKMTLPQQNEKISNFFFLPTRNKTRPKPGPNTGCLLPQKPDPRVSLSPPAAATATAPGCGEGGVCAPPLAALKLPPPLPPFSLISVTEKYGSSSATIGPPPQADPQRRQTQVAASDPAISSTEPLCFYAPHLLRWVHMIQHDALVCSF